MIRNYCVLLLLLLLAGSACALSLPEIDKLLYSNKLEQAQVEIEKLLKQEPNNPEVLRRQGYLLVLKVRTVEDEAEAQELRKEARRILLRARDLGDRDELAESLIKSIPEDGGGAPKMSKIPEAEAAMKTAETAFAERRFADAAVSYKKAGELDPKLYFAPLYEGDAWLQQGRFEEACGLYEKASKIEPNKETAYRYWGNALSRQGQVEQALQKYAEAIVAEPMSKLAWNRGLVAWAQATGAKVDIPKVRVKGAVSTDGKTISIDGSQSDDTMPAWLGYSLTLAVWKSKTFEERHPGEPYRQTLAEEAEALAAVASVASELAEQGKLKLDDDLKLLVLMRDEGLMEPFVIFSRPSQSILDEYPAYRDQHRDKLIRFVTDHVIQRDSL